MLAFIFATTKEYAHVFPGLPQDIVQGQWRVYEAWQEPVLIGICGVGPVNAAFFLGRIFECGHKISGVVSLGLAGSFDLDALPFGSLVVAETETWPEYGLRTVAGVEPQGIGFGQYHKEKEVVYSHLKLDPMGAAKKMALCLSPHWCRVCGVTVGAASGDRQTAEAVLGAAPQRGRRPVMENMEGFALALGCYQTEIPFLEIRAISNLVGSRHNKHWNIQQAFAALEQAGKALCHKE